MQKIILINNTAENIIMDIGTRCIVDFWSCMLLLTAVQHTVSHLFSSLTGRKALNKVTWSDPFFTILCHTLQYFTSNVVVFTSWVELGLPGWRHSEWSSGDAGFRCGWDYQYWRSIYLFSISIDLSLNASKCELIGHSDLPIMTLCYSRLLDDMTLLRQGIGQMLRELATASDRLRAINSQNALILLRSCFSAPKILWVAQDHAGLAKFDHIQFNKSHCTVCTVIVNW